LATAGHTSHIRLDCQSLGMHAHTHPPQADTPRNEDTVRETQGERGEREQERHCRGRATPTKGCSARDREKQTDKKYKACTVP
jgi:hypothetical protein